jgi:ADP-heptose:LPS heptosyltransferase
MLEKKGAQMAKEAQRAVILQPGALGDCILTLPLAQLMQGTLGLGGVDIIGHTEYIGILPERTCVSSVRSIDTTELHRLFAEPAQFDLVDHDPLINAFSDYAWIVTFLGEPDGPFEENLIFTANCSHSAEIITLALKPPGESTQHVAQYYIDQFMHEGGLSPKSADGAADSPLITVLDTDRTHGLDLLGQAGVDVAKPLVVLHPGSGGQHKCWYLENFLNVARALRAVEIEVVFLLGPAEAERLGHRETLQLRSAARCLTDLSLTQVVGLLGCADAFIGNDSGVTHLAAGTGLRTSALFGPTNPEQYRPNGPAVTVFRDAEDRFARAPCTALQQTVIEHVLSEIKPAAS